MAHIDPVTEEMVPCESTYVSPLNWARQFKRLMQAYNMTVEEAAEKIKKDPIECKRELYLLDCDKEEKIDILLNKFLNHFQLTAEQKGRAKSVALDIIEVLSQ